MKNTMSLPVAEFTRILTSLADKAQAELNATRDRLEALRSAELPPG